MPKKNFFTSKQRAVELGQRKIWTQLLLVGHLRAKKRPPMMYLNWYPLLAASTPWQSGIGRTAILASMMGGMMSGSGT